MLTVLAWGVNRGLFESGSYINSSRGHVTWTYTFPYYSNFPSNFSQVNASISFWTQIYTYPNHQLNFDHGSCYSLVVLPSVGRLITFIYRTDCQEYGFGKFQLLTFNRSNRGWILWVFVPCVNICLRFIIYADEEQRQQSTAVVLPQNVICCGENTAPHGVIPAVDELSVSRTRYPAEESEDGYCEKLWIRTIFAHIAICRRETTRATTSSSKRNDKQR